MPGKVGRESYHEAHSKAIVKHFVFILKTVGSSTDFSRSSLQSDMEICFGQTKAGRVVDDDGGEVFKGIKNGSTQLIHLNLKHCTAASHFPTLGQHARTEDSTCQLWCYSRKIWRILPHVSVGQQQTKLLDQISLGNAGLTKAKQMSLLQVISEPLIYYCEFAKKEIQQVLSFTFEYGLLLQSFPSQEIP